MQAVSINKGRSSSVSSRLIAAFYEFQDFTVSYQYSAQCGNSWVSVAVKAQYSSKMMF